MVNTYMSVIAVLITKCAFTVFTVHTFMFTPAINVFTYLPFIITLCDDHGTIIDHLCLSYCKHVFLSDKFDFIYTIIMLLLDWLWSLFSNEVDESDNEVDVDEVDESDNEVEEVEGVEVGVEGGSLKMPVIIAVSGKLGTGKDYIIKHHILPMIKGKVCKMAFADHIKVNVASQDPLVSLTQCLEGSKDVYLRKKLQVAGTEQGRDVYGPDIWVRTLENWIKLRQIRGDNIDVVLVTDCRFPNEAEWVTKNNGLLIRIESPIRNEEALTHESAGDTEKLLSIMEHPSETSLDDYCFAYYIQNDPDHQIRPQVQSIIEQYACDTGALCFKL
jgi:hypothetical protein